ncbi:myb-like protein D [Nasonia vitripennis]|uniref:Uncharacterized protein n=1 Tax=Nasonia vitripennis TaxID=7425 RepID=A0A7M7Q9K7_NASVI|nr:myb-like protein D [Nasonia vitripennis]
MALPRQSGLRNMRERIRTLISNAPTLMMMLDHAAWALDAIDSLPPIPPMAAMQNLYPTGSRNHPVSSASPRRGSRSRSSSSSSSSSSCSSSNWSSSVKSKKRGSSNTFWQEESLVRASLPKLEQMSIGKSNSNSNSNSNINSNSNSNDSGRKRKAEDKAEGQIKKPCDEMKKSEKPSTHSNTEVKKDVRVPLSVSSLFNADVKASS